MAASRKAFTSGQKMPIKSLEFEDFEHAWKLKPATFESFNLLVGLSGVGKTRALAVINQLGRAAQGSRHSLAHCAWTVHLETPRGVFIWKARTEPDGTLAPPENEDDEFGQPERTRPRFISETVNDQNGSVVAERNQDKLILMGKSVPRLRAEDSITSLFEEEPMRSLRTALGAIHLSRARRLTASLRQAQA